MILTVEVEPRAWGDVQRRLTQALTGVDGGVAITMRPLADRVRSTIVQEKLVAILSGFFGGLALLLAGVGLYGVTAYGVSCRRTEIGVRMALGAEPAGVIRLILGRVAWLVGAGVVAGAAVSYWAAKYLGPALLFGLQGRDTRTFVTAAIVLDRRRVDHGVAARETRLAHRPDAGPARKLSGGPRVRMLQVLRFITSHRRQCDGLTI